jgi:hypothetical protein
MKGAQAVLAPTELCEVQQSGSPDHTCGCVEGGWPGCKASGDQRAAMAVSADDQRRRHVIVEQREGGGVGAVGGRQRAAGVAVVLGVGQRRGGAKIDAGQIGTI